MLTKKDKQEIVILIDEHLSPRFKGIDERFDQLDRNLRALIEDVRSDVRILAEGIMTVQAESSRKWDEGMAWLRNHETRITTLEINSPH